MDKQRILGWVIGLVVVAGVIYLIVSQGPKAGQKPAGLEPPPAAVTGEPTVIGAVLPLTGDGATYGIPIQRAIEMAVADINAANGVSGKPLKVAYEDGKCDGKESVNAAQKLINVTKVKYIIGGACSGETLGFAPIANQNKVVVISPSATSPDITTKGGPYVFRFSPSDALAGSVAAKYAQEKLNAKTAAIISEQTDYAQGLRRTFAAEFRKKARVLVDETFQTSETNFQSIALKVKNAKLDVIYVVPQTPTPGVLLVKQLREQGAAGAVLTAEVMIGRDVVEKNAEGLDGMVGFEAYFDENSDRAKPFLDTYLVRYGEKPPYPFFMANAHAITYLMRDLIMQNGMDTAKALNALVSLKGWAGGALGSVTLDRAGDPVWSDYAVKQVFQGKLNDVMVFKAL